LRFAQTEIARLTRERDEALEREAATSEVLPVIRAPPGELKPVFETILENAAHLCQASFSTLYLAEGNVYRTAATYNVPLAQKRVNESRW
jgi:two-component system, NtrC family, sensor kinase